MPRTESQEFITLLNYNYINITEIKLNELMNFYIEVGLKVIPSWFDETFIKRRNGLGLFVPVIGNTECVTDLDYRSEIIFVGSILTSF